MAHTSVLTRAIRTLDLALEEMGRLWVPVRRHWRLNERHYGALTGLDKAETKAALRRRAVPGLAAQLRHPSAADAGRTTPSTSAPIPATPAWPRTWCPATECLADVVVRMLPYWYDAIAPDLLAGRTVLVAAHGNSLRALIKHLDGISDADIAELEIPTGVPIVYELDAGLAVSSRRELGDPEAIAAAAEAVRRQGDRCTGAGAGLHGRTHDRPRPLHAAPVPPAASTRRPRRGPTRSATRERTSGARLGCEPTPNSDRAAHRATVEQPVPTSAVPDGPRHPAGLPPKTALLGCQP